MNAKSAARLILERMEDFAERFGRQVQVEGTTWRYYRLGTGSPILWLTGGLRRAALGFAFMERLGERHTVIAPDYPPVRTVGVYMRAFDAILQAEGVGRFALAGQSYGGLLAQAYLAHVGQPVERLILSSTGPADYGRTWLPAEYAAIALAHLLPERAVKSLLAGGLLRVLALPEAKHAAWLHVIEEVMRHDLTRADVVSHFAVAADLIRTRLVTPAAFRAWTGRVVILSAENDPTQSPKDIRRYERLFGRPVEVVSLDDMGHVAALFFPSEYVRLLERAFASGLSREADTAVVPGVPGSA